MTTIKNLAIELTKIWPYEVNPQICEYGEACIRKGLELALERIRHWQNKRPGLGIVRHEIEQILAEKEE